MFLNNNQYLHALVRSAPIGICILDAKTLVNEIVNDTFLEIAGRKYEEVVDKHFWDTFAEAKAPFGEALANVINTGSAFKAEDVKLNRIGIADGIFVTFIYSPILGDAGKVEKISVWVIENTDKVMARRDLEKVNEKLELNQEHLRNMVRQAPVGMCILSGSPLYVEEINELFLEILGKKREDFQGTPYWEVISDAVDFYKPITEKVMDTGESFYAKEHEILLVRNGSTDKIYVDFVYEPMIDDHGNAFAIMIVASEVTDKVNARRKLQELNQEMVAINEELLSSNEELGTTLEELGEAHRNLEEINHRLNVALEAGSLGISEVDLSTGYMTTNDQFKRNFGQPVDQPFDYIKLFECMLPQYREPIRQSVRTAIAERTVYKGEFQVKWPDDSIHWISAHGKARYNADGSGFRLVGVTSDITQDKLFEQRKDDFLSIASHELKTPMTSLKGSLQLLERIKDKADIPIQSKLITQSIKSMQKMSELIEELLQVNRLDVGEMELKKSEFSVFNLLNECCNHVRMDGRYDLVFEGDKSLTVFADEHRIDQVVVNFVNNAVKYAPNAEKIILKAEKIGKYAKISVKDFGPGIPPEKTEKLFDRYYQIKNTKGNQEGLGLGLYISKEIIHRHHGQVGVDSVFGEGSTFWFTIPI